MPDAFAYGKSKDEVIRDLNRQADLAAKIRAGRADADAEAKRKFDQLGELHRRKVEKAAAAEAAQAESARLAALEAARAHAQATADRAAEDKLIADHKRAMATVPGRI